MNAHAGQLALFFFPSGSQTISKMMAHIAAKKSLNNTALPFRSCTLVILNFTPTYKNNQSFLDFENNSEV